MASGRLVAATLIAITVAAVFIGPLASVVGDNSGVVEQSDTVTIQTDEYVDLSGYDVTSNYTVEASDGSELTEGTDYEINQTDGSISAVEGSSNVNDGDSVTVLYEYAATDGTTETVVGLIPLFAGLLIVGTAAARMRQMM